MVLNNFALIAGIILQEVEAWFQVAFIDAYDWVMQTNVIGVGQLLMVELLLLSLMPHRQIISTR